MVAVPGPPPYGMEPIVPGLSYVGGAPVAVIGGETVFLVYADGPGWGYWDHYHHWHGAPERFRDHLEHFHPRGAGFRGYAGPHGGPVHAAAAHGPAHPAAIVHPAAKAAPPPKKK